MIPEPENKPVAPTAPAPTPAPTPKPADSQKVVKWIDRVAEKVRAECDAAQKRMPKGAALNDAQIASVVGDHLTAGALEELKELVCSDLVQRMGRKKGPASPTPPAGPA